MKNVYKHGKIIIVIILGSLLLFLLTGSYKMGHGAPDNYEVQQKATTFRLDDMAELAVRLGGISIFDRRGDVYSFDSFENGIDRWALGGSGANYSNELNSKWYKSGGFSQKLITPLGATDYVRIYTVLPYFKLSKYGYEYSFLYTGDTDKIDVICYLYTGTHYYKAAIRYDYPNYNLSYLVSPDNWKVIDSNLILPFWANTFNIFKLVINWETKKYTRLIINNNEYDLSSYNIYNTPYPSTPMSQFMIEVRAKSGLTTEFSFDDFILTINEP